MIDGLIGREKEQIMYMKNQQSLKWQNMKREGKDLHQVDIEEKILL